MLKTLVDAQNAISKSQALIARSTELVTALAVTLDLCRQKHDRHEFARQALERSREEATALSRFRLPPHGTGQTGPTQTGTLNHQDR